MFNFPEWSSQLITIVILIGFPIAIIFAWAFESTPDGVKKTEASKTDNLLDQTKKSTAPIIHRTIKFCIAPDGVRLAYMTVGQGPPIIKTANWLSHIELDWQSSVYGHLLRDLSNSNQLTIYDERGNGLSDWDADEFSLDSFVTDLETVVEAAGVDRFVLLGFSQGCAISIAYAVKHPERVSHLVLLGGFAEDFRGQEQIDAMSTLMESGWGQKNPTFRQMFTSSLLPDATKEEIDELNEMQRITTSPQNAVQLFRAIHSIDVTKVASKVTVPTLVFHSREEQGVPLEAGRKMASLIPGARFVGLDSENHILLEREPAYSKFKEEVFGFINNSD
jgi:pimeloyl-ACP methyl ester carboxylesterase